ncbi:MAG TPA: beta family protein [Chitinophagales bacterium]|nr:beta family protein [Chitinophagales bacterium]
MKKYYPILLSKAGEATALQHLTPNVKNDICPVIEMLPTRITAITQFLTRHWNFNGNEVVIDFSWYEDFSTQSIREIRLFLNTLFKAGVNVIPAIQKNSPLNYSNLVSALLAAHQCKLCIRTSNQSGGFLNYNQDINDIITLVNTTPGNTILLLDLGYAENHNHAMLATIAGMSINALKPTKNHWSDIVVAASSFPANLAGLAPRQAPHRLRRFEWDIWQALHITLPNIKYGDFGTKYPFYSNAPFPGTISVKYTVTDEFVIYRGELTDHHADGHGQYITHAQRLVRSADYSGINFSWGDLQINSIANENVADANRRTGNPSTWVQFSQNHHITLLHNLL